MSLVLWFFALTAILLGLKVTLRSWEKRRITKVLLLPGAVLATASRSLAAVIARAPVKAVNMPWRAGDAVEHGPSPVPILGPAALAILPFAAGAAAVLALREVLQPSLAPVSLPVICAGPDAFGRVLGTCIEALATLASFPGGTSWNERTAAFGYLAIAVLVYTAPAWKDWRHIAAWTCAAAGLAALVDFLGLRAGFLSRGWFIRRLYEPVILDGVAFLIAVSLATLAAVGILRIATALLRGALSPAGSPARTPAKEKAGAR